MEFSFRTTGAAIDLAALERRLVAIDPAAVLDLDESGQTLRVATTATCDELLACLRAAGMEADAGDLDQLPSVCCGGCSG
jgi:hypothetical protein